MRTLSWYPKLYSTFFGTVLLLALSNGKNITVRQLLSLNLGQLHTINTTPTIFVNKYLLNTYYSKGIVLNLLLI